MAGKCMRSAMENKCLRSRWTSFAIFVTGSFLVILACCVKWEIFPNELDKQVGINIELNEDNTETWDQFVSIIWMPYSKYYQ